jgi:hypothetical protein
MGSLVTSRCRQGIHLLSGSDSEWGTKRRKAGKKMGCTKIGLSLAFDSKWIFKVFSLQHLFTCYQKYSIYAEYFK